MHLPKLFPALLASCLQTASVAGELPVDPEHRRLLAQAFSSAVFCQAYARRCLSAGEHQHMRDFAALVEERYDLTLAQLERRLTGTGVGLRQAAEGQLDMFLDQMGGCEVARAMNMHEQLAERYRRQRQALLAQQAPER